MGNGEHWIPLLAPQWPLDQTQGIPKNTPSHFWEVLGDLQLKCATEELGVTD